MKISLRTVLAISLLLVICFTAPGQNRVVSGLVLDEKGESIIGAGVVCIFPASGKGTQAAKGTSTDLDGRFRLEVGNAEAIEISALGMVTETYMLKDKNGYRRLEGLTFILKEDVNMLDQVVVTGYAQTTVKKITGSVGVITSEAFRDKPISSMDALMQGELAGVSVSATSGQPGSQAKIRIRGTNNLSSNSSPLWVVDGVPLQNDKPTISSEQLATGGFDDLFVNGIGNINPNDIASITVLKDAAAAAIYGSKASNGVIVVTTKRGEAGKMKLNYSNNFSWSFRPQRYVGLMNSEQKLSWEQELWDEFSAKGYQQSLTDPTAIFPVVGIVGQIRAGVGPYANIKGNREAQDEAIANLAKHNTNWYDELFRNSFSHNHHLSLGGGSEGYKYYVSMGVNDENGMLINNKYQRYSLNTRLSMTPKDWIKLEVGADFAHQVNHSPDSYVNAFTYAYFANPYERPYNDDGSYCADNTFFSLGYYNGRGVEEVMPENGFNILRELNSNYTHTKYWASTLRGSADISILKQLKFSGLASYSYSNNSTDKVVDKNTYTAFRDRLGYDDKSQTKLYGSISQNTANRSSYVLRGHFNYNDKFAGLHTLNIIAGAEVRGSASNTIFSKRYNYDPVTGTTSLPQISGPSDEWLKEVERLNGEYFTKNRYASFYASADYYFSNTIVLNASFRSDGSSNFGSDRQFNPTWSAGAAWHIGEEKWMKGISFLSHATVRAAYGYTGDISTSTTHQLVMQYVQQVYRNFGDKSYLMGTIPSAPNPELGWERTSDGKLGLDLGFLKDRISINTEGYMRLSSNIVASSQVLSTTGFTTVYRNCADILNSGVEFTINGKIVQSRDWNLNASLNFAYNYNKVLEYSPYYGHSITAKDRYVAGYPVGAILAGKLMGIDTDEGLYSFQLRSDAEIKTASDLNKADNYRYYLGTTIAPFTGGFTLSASWKFLRLSVNGTYSFGNKVYDAIQSPASYLNARHNGVSTETVQSQYSDLYSNHLNVTSDRTDRWTADNRTGVKYPRIYDHFGYRYNFEGHNPMDWNIVNSIYLKDVSYLRIKSIILSCSLPEKWVKKAKMGNVSLHASLNNFITITGYEGMDPEVPGATYPTTRSVSFGMNIGF